MYYSCYCSKPPHRAKYVLGVLATVTPIAILVTLIALYFQKERLHEQER